MAGKNEPVRKIFTGKVKLVEEQQQLKILVCCCSLELTN
jgi:hypothetical protein